MYNGAKYDMATEPLEKYIEMNKIKLVPPHSACWRGYHAS